MMFNYSKGYQAGYAGAREHYERIIAILREQLTDALRDAHEAREAERVAADRVLSIYGASAISPAGVRDVDRRVQSDAAVSRAANFDPFAEVDYDHPASTYKRKEDSFLDTEFNDGRATEAL